MGGGASPAGPDTVPQSELENGVRLEVVVGNGVSGHIYPILDRGLTMGRAEDRDVVVPDPASSRHHCHITKEDSEYVLHDNGSANGVFVNAVRVRECTLSDGDLLRIGNTELRFVNPYTVEEDPYTEPPHTDGPSEPAVPDEPSLSASVSTRRSEYEAPPPASGGRGGMVLGALLGIIVLGTVVAVGAVALVAIILWATAPTVTANDIPARPPEWTLNLPPDLPASDTATLFAEGSQAAANSDYKLALQDFYRVLKHEPGHSSAKKFAAFTAEVLVATTMQRELSIAEKERLEREQRRDLLLSRYRGSRNNRVRRSAERELQQDFREDLKVQEEMNWGLTDRQRTHRDAVDKIEKRATLDDYDEVVRLSRKLLAESTEPELRDAVEVLLAEAEAKQSKRVAKVWREAVLKEALGNTSEALADYKAIIKEAPNNVSARLRIERLEAQANP